MGSENLNFLGDMQQFDSKLAKRIRAEASIVTIVTWLSASVYWFSCNYIFEQNIPLSVVTWAVAPSFIVLMSAVPSWLSHEHSLVWAPFASLAAIMLLIAGPPLWLLSTSSLIIFAFMLPRAWTSVRMNPMSLLGIGAVAGSLFVFGLAEHYHVPDWRTGFVELGYLHQDPLFHASIASILDTYGVISTGADGLGSFGYHIGSHLLFAGLSKTLDTSIMDFYHVGAPLVMGPLILWGLRLGIVSMDLVTSRKMNPAVSWAGVWIVLAGILPVNNLLPSPFSQHSPFLSESYGVAIFMLLTFSAGVVPSFISFLRANEKTTRRYFGVITIVVILTAIGAFKLSVPFVTLPVLGYLLIRTRKRWGLPFILFYAAFSMACLVAVYALFASNMGHAGELDPMVAVMKFKETPSVFFTLPWLTLFLLLRFWNARVTRQAVREGEFLDVELVLLLAIVGALPGKFMHVAAGSDHYFSDIVNWVAIPLVFSLISAVRVEQLKSGTKILLVFVVAQFALHAVANIMLISAQEMKYSRCVSGNSPRCAEVGITPYRKQSGQRESLLQQLESIRRVTPERAVVFVSHDSTFWDQPAMEKQGLTIQPPLLVPAIAQRLALGGLNHTGLPIDTYGFSGLRREMSQRIENSEEAYAWVCSRNLDGLVTLDFSKPEYSFTFRSCSESD